MKPCAQSNCPALATRGDYCPVHSPGLLTFVTPADYAAEQPAVSKETRAAIETRKRIARLYKHEDR